MFYITISNGLLQGDHRKRMGSAVWEFMWCIDKVTRVDEDGTGWVLGGKPIKLEDLATQMGVSRDTVSRNLIDLEAEGYIFKTITPYGMVIKVSRVKKRFGKNVEPSSAKMSNLRRTNVEPNKTVSVDSTVRPRTSSNDVGDVDDLVREGEETFGRRTAEKRSVFLLFSPEGKQPWWIHKQQGEAALRLLDSKGMQQIQKAMRLVHKHRDDPFCPVINRPFQLEAKWDDLLSYAERNGLN